VAAATSDARTRAERAMNRAPAVTDPLSSLTGGSAGRIRPRKNAEPRNDSAGQPTVAAEECAASRGWDKSWMIRP
jgi:hypothetical protein